MSHASHLFGRIFGRSEDEKRRYKDMPLIWHLGQWDAQAYGAFVGFGVPLIAWLVPDYETRVHIYFCFMYVVPLYWYVEIKEILVQVDRHGLLRPHQTSHQRNSMYFVIYGVIIAVVIWGLASVGGYAHPKYGWLEWAVIIGTLINGFLVIFTLNLLIDDYLQATAGQRRFEEEE